MITFNYRRKTLTLGKIDRKDAFAFAANLDLVINCQKHLNPIPPHLQLWFSSLSHKHRVQLSDLGVIGQQDSIITVKELIERFLKDYKARQLAKEITASTVTQFQSAMLRFPAYFKKTKIMDIEPKRRFDKMNAQAVFSVEVKEMFSKIESWQREHYALASWSRANGRLKEVGNWAVKQGICDYNPFSQLKCPKQINSSRNIEVHRQWILDAMEQSLHPDTRLLFVLARFCGLRMLSEARTIRKQDVDFEKKTLQILDSKKKEYRTMPLFSTVEQELINHQSEIPWASYVLSPFTLRSTNQNATKLMKQACDRAGIPIWPKFHQNMRSSCENDLLRQGFDERKVTLWIGHTISISRQHYQKQFEADFEEAVRQSTY